MKRMFGMLALGAVLAAGATGCSSLGTKAKVQESGKAGFVRVPAKDDTVPADGIPRPMREFRAAWVATVANIDWPSTNTLTTEQQKAEAIDILEKSKAINLNALVLQVRPTADALYQSDLEPWSEYLTGAQGKAPNPYYDPLQFWVEEAHKRGIQIHAWFNPYRARHTVAKSPDAPNHISNTHPEVVKQYGKFEWMDPSEKHTQEHSLAVVRDVVRRYDIDGVHFDDYFYPYSSYADGADFPDDESYARYKASGGTLGRSDWRRKGVNDFILAIHKTVREEKPGVLFGLSPFGIWRPGHPASIQGFDQYEGLYADAKLWLNEGWVDYWTPQLYWTVRRVPQSYPVLLQWWAEQNHKHVHLWPGNSISAIDGKTPGTVEEMINQIMVTRGNPGASGNVFFSFKVLDKNLGGVNDELVKAVYARPALVPATPWLDDKAPDAPTAAAQKAGDDVTVTWSGNGDEAAFTWVVYWERSGRWDYTILPKQEATFTVKAPAAKDGAKPAPVTRIAVSAVDRLGNESSRSIVDLK